MSKHITLEEFKKSPPPQGTEAILGKLNGGTFMECHTAIFASSGIWIEDLVPVFQKLDAMLMTRPLPAGIR
jgi:hypothetical protein